MRGAIRLAALTTGVIGKMDIRFTVSPDFPPNLTAAWSAFGGWLGERIGESLSFDLYPGFSSQRDAVEEGRIDLIYATPFDAAMLVREKGFAGLARACDRADEAVVAVRNNHPAASVTDLTGNVVVAGGGDPQVTKIGQLLLQPADVLESDDEIKSFDTYSELARSVIDGSTEVGVFLKRAFDELDREQRVNLRPLVTSEIHVVHHQLMGAARIVAIHGPICTALLAMDRDDTGRRILAELGISAWERLGDGDIDYMIDLMDTLFA